MVLPVVAYFERGSFLCFRLRDFNSRFLFVFKINIIILVWKSNCNRFFVYSNHISIVACAASSRIVWMRHQFECKQWKKKRFQKRKSKYWKWKLSSRYWDLTQWFNLIAQNNTRPKNIDWMNEKILEVKVQKITRLCVHVQCENFIFFYLKLCKKGLQSKKKFVQCRE